MFKLSSRSLGKLEGVNPVLVDTVKRAIELSKQFIETLEHADEEMGLFYDSSCIDPVSINYRLGHDEDRQKSNYMRKNENGHVTNKKCHLMLEKPQYMVNQQTFDFIPCDES